MPHPSPTIDADVVRRLRDGDNMAFDEVYKTFAPVLYQRLLRLLKDTDTVEEILQDTFLKLWEKREQIDPQQGFKTYLYRIADHLAIDLFRKISRDKALQQELWASTVSFYLHSEETLIAKEQRQLISAAIDRLPPKRKQILLLCKLEEKSYQEVAELMGISVSTVSNQLVKAIKEIKSYVLQSTRDEQAVILYLLLAFHIA
ncbi:RNA polymerase sigma factor [Parapedobacter koreensis]|uniref:RNA polymerase sigma-70 factor, ECF subfamily n=1 Tax=Parapedobacter koreensis TaxID=332977 RepID=A0A1H7SRE9_9SPHI|nr:RNA polymerase sigma-70 factor [Parapedobacter koreensis]SEL74107.1 RNA polymerase sigma-70 factor, ECF subfamily [Parapedobacter koreensis]